MRGKVTLTPSLFFGLLAGLFLAVLAFSQAAASIGLSVETFRPLGGSFFSWRAGQTRAGVALMTKETRAHSEMAERIGRAALIHAPLSPRSLWLVGKSMDVQGQRDRARQVMAQAEKVSRRDGAVQLWLGTDRLQNVDIAGALHHYDLLIRGGGEAANAAIPRMALVMQAREGRQFIAPYIREDNPWLFQLLAAAVHSLPRAAPLAQLLIERDGSAPNVANIEQVYRPLVARLMSEGAYREALRLYPKLPGANKDSLRDVSGAKSGGIDTGYPPFIWSFAEGNSQGGELVALDASGTGIYVFGSPGTKGVAASKIIASRPDDVFSWKIIDRTGNLQSQAKWVATCLLGASKDRRVESANLFASAVSVNRIMKISLPKDCDLMRIDMLVAGGIGRDPANLIVGELKVSREAKTQ